MSRLRIAVALHCFGSPIKKSVLEASRAGASGIQIDARDDLPPADLTGTGRKQFLHHLRDLGLSVASLVFPTQRTLYDPEHLDARIDATKTAMQFAWDLGARVLVLRAGRIPGDAASPEFTMFRSALGDLARFGNQVGVVPSLTPAGDLIDALAALLEDVSEGPVGINFDPAAFVFSHQDPGNAFRGLHQYTRHVQARDGVRDMDGSGQEVPIGRGEVEWDELLAMLDEAAYSGWITIDRTQGDDRGGDAARAVQFLKRLSLG